MAPPQDNTKLYVRQHNRSLSSLSVNSEAATFHSAIDHIPGHEMSHTTSPTPMPVPAPTTQPKMFDAPATGMARKDSGYADTSSRRTSTSSSSTRPLKPRRRSARSSVSGSGGGRGTTPTSQARRLRPAVQSRHTSPPIAVWEQLYHFPPLPQQSSSPPSSTKAPLTTSTLIAKSEISPSPPLPSPPPATVQYWTSDSTRRLEYAAIDAASKGLRGFLFKLAPDCMLPPRNRRSRRVLFHEDEADEDDRRSVRRYRLVLPEEESEGGEIEKVAGINVGGPGSRVSGGKRLGLFRRWTSFGRGG